MRHTNDSVVGDTFHLKDRPTPAIVTNVTRPNPMVYAGFFPFDPADQGRLKGAVEKVCHFLKGYMVYSVCNRTCFISLLRFL